MLTTGVAHSRAITRFLSFAACLMSALMLLSFPVQIRPHDFNSHFRAADARRSIVGHTSVERVEVRGVDRVVKIGAWPLPFLVVEPEFKIRPLPSAQLVSLIPRTRLFLRLKLGPSPSNSQDPLI